MDKIEIAPKGVCSRKIVVEVENEIIQNVSFVGGCPGNTLGLASLLKGMKIDEAIERLSGIKFGFKSTSCPNELTKIKKEYLLFIVFFNS